MSPDAFVQMGILGAWFGLYGRIECVYEPAMTKSFLHGRTEAVRTVQKESVDFIQVGLFLSLYCSLSFLWFKWPGSDIILF